MSEQLKHAFSTMDHAKEFLLEHKLSPDPINYSVVFDYLETKTPALAQAIDDHLGRTKKLDQYWLRELFNQYLIEDKDNSAQVNEAVDKLLTTVISDFDESGTMLGHFSSLLHRNHEQIEQTRAPELNAIVNSLLGATQTAISAQKKLTEKLHEAEDQAHQLQEDLVRARKAATTDLLTGLLNRQGMLERLDGDMGDQVAVIMFDIDFFKKLNDNHGHLLGDRVLTQVGEEILKKVRGSDIAVRFGGEEFIVFLPETQIEGAQRVAENIRTGISQLVWINKRTKEKIGPISISAGITKKQKIEDWQQCIARADEALYDAKEGGRNCVKVKFE